MAVGQARPGLRRRVGLVGATASGVGIILGAGIYVLVGEAAGIAGNGVWIAFLLGGLLVAGTSLSYAELASMLPESGAASAYAREAFGRRVGFITGWMDVVENAIAAPAVALGFASYFAALTGLDRTAIAIGVVILCMAIVLAGVSQTIAFASLFAAIETMGLLVVIVVGLPYLGNVNLLDVHGGAGSVLGATALVFFAFVGFEEMASLSEEVREPTRNVPRAMLIAAGLTTAFYVLVSAIAVSVVPWPELANSAGPLARVVSVASSARLGDALALVALFATFNTVLLVLATGPRVMFGMARSGLLPPVFGKVWAARGTPWVAIVSVTIVSIGFALTGNIRFIAEVSNFAIFLLFIVVNGSVIRLRRSRPDQARPFRMRPSVGWVPIPAAIGLAGAVGLAFVMDLNALLVGMATLVAGALGSFLLVRRQAR